MPIKAQIAARYHGKRPMTRAEILDFLSISETTLWRWVRAKKFPKPVNEHRGKLLWRRTDVEKWYGEDL